MSDAHASNLVEYSVSEISGALKRTIEGAFGQVRVRGEVSGFKGPHASGHCYFSLKDQNARLEAVIWKSTAARLKFLPQEGLEVIATGRITTFPGSSKYQIVIDRLEPAGIGALMALIEERRRKLAAEGLFDEARKKPLPYLPRVIGVITSPTGAVIRDILHRLADRFPRPVLLWPVRVQGEGCAAEVAAAIQGFNALEIGGAMPRPDLIIVARGGGSLEDLWGFNEEVVVRAAAQSAIPLISAVGHETDWTLIDHVADKRAPTPTGAAEIAVPVRAELVATLSSLAGRLASGVLRHKERKRAELVGAGAGACLRAIGSFRCRASASTPACWRSAARRNGRSSGAAIASPSLPARWRAARRPRLLATSRQRLKETARQLPLRRCRGDSSSGAGISAMWRGSSPSSSARVLRTPSRRQRARAGEARKPRGAPRSMHAQIARGPSRQARGPRPASRKRRLSARAGARLRTRPGRGGAPVAHRRRDRAPGKRSRIEFADGKIGAIAAGPASGARPRRRSSRAAGDAEPSLFE